MAFMSTTRTCLLAVALAQQGLAGYTLADDYTPSNFFSKFSFFDTADPTHGFVSYLDENTAQSQGLIKTASDSIFMGVDSTNVASSAGRSSVRITSNKAYNQGLVILDASHMPEGCGTWPAFWMVGANWPLGGEIDIIEGVNQQIGNAMTLHTGPGCSIDNSGFTGALTTSNCYVNAPGQSNNQGCGISDSNANTYGSGFNANQGGVYATEWTDSGISIWFFPRNNIPHDINAGEPNPSSWGMPIAHYAGGCNFQSSFSNLQIVFDTTFCGDWAGAVWSSGSCASQAPTCQAFVQNNPSAFANAYWTVNSLKVYQDNGVAQPAPALQTTTAGPTGVASSIYTSVAPIPASTAPPFSSTVVLWNGGFLGGDDEVSSPTSVPVPVAAAPAAPAVPTTTMVTVAQPTAKPSLWDDNPDTGDIVKPVAAAPKPAQTSSVYLWNGYDIDFKAKRDAEADRRHARHLLSHNRKAHA